ncbi:hypothetical protein [Lichenicoccus roseus]|uniref:Uncharacterized protein n=1 Tax=Lichenicoccus roseus TaxID=2683649 RepID=A0A5R9JEE6_9PROT|nr:hypothetical protein [Lichenicoccus roseus]TLU72668.1 hypothetical protein FE263_11575 [Lichenicoccus roseus]
MPPAKRLKRDNDSGPPDKRRPPGPATDRAASARQARKGQDTIRLVDPLTTRLGTRIDTNALIFDSDWYRAQYPDVAASRVDPVRHYLNDGAREGRDPNPYFDTDWYVTNNPDVAAARQNPFLHYLLHGAHEGRLPAPPPGAEAGPPAA